MALTAAFTCSQEQVTGQPRFSRVVLFFHEVRVYSHSVDPCGIVVPGRAHYGIVKFVPEQSFMLSQAMAIQSFPNPAMVEDSGTAAQ